MFAAYLLKLKRSFCRRQRCERIVHEGNSPLSNSAPVHPVQVPIYLYETELASLERMGFNSRTNNLRALMATNGDIYEAIDRLTNRFYNDD